jgi:hypothetical protein
MIAIFEAEVCFKAIKNRKKRSVNDPNYKTAILPVTMTPADNITAGIMK